MVPISLPALRERREDIPLLAYHFLQKYAARSSSQVTKISPDAMRLLSSHHWQGNVRELENAIEHAVVFCRDDTMTPAELPFGRPSNGAPTDPAEPASSDPADYPLSALPYREAKERSLEAFEHAYFEGLLARTQGNVSEAARQAGLDRSNFRRAVKRAGVRVRDDE